MQYQIFKTSKESSFIVYDFEVETSSHCHRPNLCEVSLLEVSDDHTYINSFKRSKSFEGFNCAKELCDWLFSGKMKDCTVFAHNQAGYDAKFVLQWCITHDMLPDKYIQQGSGITYIFSKFNLRFVDTYKFFLSPLHKLSETYDIDTVKGFVPHRFNTPEKSKLCRMLSLNRKVWPPKHGPANAWWIHDLV